MPGDVQRALLIRQYTDLVRKKGKDMAEEFRALHELRLPEKGEMLLARGHDAWNIVMLQRVALNEGDGQLEYIGPYYLLPELYKVYCVIPKGISDAYVMGEHIYSILDGKYMWEGKTERSKKLKVPQILKSLRYLRQWVKPVDPQPDLSVLMSA